MIYQFTNGVEWKRDFGLTDQIRRASVSVMANIAEGYGAGADAEFIRFLRYAQRSSIELQSHAYIALDQGYISQAQFEQVYVLANDIIHLIGGSFAISAIPAPPQLATPDSRLLTYEQSQPHLDAPTRN